MIRKSIQNSIVFFSIFFTILGDYCTKRFAICRLKAHPPPKMVAFIMEIVKESNARMVL